MSSRRVPRLPGSRDEPVAVAMRRGDPERVDFHFPVEIHMEEAGPPLDLDAVADHVFTRLARRLR